MNYGLDFCNVMEPALAYMAQMWHANSRSLSIVAGWSIGRKRVGPPAVNLSIFCFNALQTCWTSADKCG